jgi:hypothetical protein
LHHCNFPLIISLQRIDEVRSMRPRTDKQTGVSKGFLLALTSGVILIMATCCCQMQLGGVTAEEAFSDPLTGEMVSEAVQGHNARVAELINQGADVNAVGKDELTPLAWVLASGHLYTAELLLHKGADPNYRMSSGESLMAMAAGGDSQERLKLMLDYGGDPNSRGLDDRPATIYAVEQNRLGNLKLLIDRGADVNAHTPDGSESAAFSAATFKQFSTIKYLLQKGYDFDLHRLGTRVEIGNLNPDSPECDFCGEVLTILQKKGVRFPCHEAPTPNNLCMYKLRDQGNRAAALIVEQSEKTAERKRNNKPAKDNREAHGNMERFLKVLKNAKQGTQGREDGL